MMRRRMFRLALYPSGTVPSGQPVELIERRSDESLAQTIGRVREAMRRSEVPLSAYMANGGYVWSLTGPDAEPDLSPRCTSTQEVPWGAWTRHTWEQARDGSVRRLDETVASLEDAITARPGYIHGVNLTNWFDGLPTVYAGLPVVYSYLPTEDRGTFLYLSRFLERRHNGAELLSTVVMLVTRMDAPLLPESPAQPVYTAYSNVVAATRYERYGRNKGGGYGVYWDVPNLPGILNALAYAVRTHLRAQPETATDSRAAEPDPFGPDEASGAPT